MAMIELVIWFFFFLVPLLVTTGVFILQLWPGRD